MPRKRRKQARRIPFNKWMDYFANKKDPDTVATAVLQRLQSRGIHRDRILMLLWLWCSAPSQSDLQTSLLGTDKQIARLRKLILEVANQTARLNQKLAVQMFLSIVQRSAALPTSVLPSGLDLKTIPQQFQTLPAVLRHYQQALEVGRALLKNAVADRPLFQGRLLQVLYFAVKMGDHKGSPYRNMASLLQVGLLAAGVTDREIHEANLEKQIERFRHDHPKDINAAFALAALVNDQPWEWHGLLLAFLVTKGLIRNLLPL